MAKKDKVQFQYSDDLDSVDSELAEAMERLDLTNTRVDELLRDFDPPSPVAADAASPDSGGAAGAGGETATEPAADGSAN
jgi:hypothetical protein